jgi:hypothetical protein
MHYTLSANEHFDEMIIARVLSCCCNIYDGTTTFAFQEFRQKHAWWQYLESGDDIAGDGRSVIL